MLKRQQSLLKADGHGVRQLRQVSSPTWSRLILNVKLFCKPHKFRQLLQHLHGRPFALSWVTPTLAACSYPETDEAIEAVASQGISLIINLHTRALSSETLPRFGLSQVHLPTRDFTAPRLADICLGITALDRAFSEGKKAVVHCGAGLGRTGCFIACYLVKTGLGARESIAEVRRIRPGSIETRGQETLVRRYEDSLRRSSPA